MLIWRRTYNSQYSNDGAEIVPDNSGNVLIRAGSAISDTVYRSLLLKYGSSGDLIWERNYGNNQRVYSAAIKVDNGGNSYLTASIDSNGLILKYDPSGNLIFENEFHAKYHQIYYGRLDLDAQNNIYVTSIRDSSSKYSCMTLKYAAPISVTQISSQVPSTHTLYQNFPNPFNPGTNINFNIARKEFVNLSVYNILGRKVEVLVNEVLDRGTYNVSFNGSHLNSGIYFYKLQTEDYSEVRKMNLVK